jgi:hypothetical protein
MAGTNLWIQPEELGPYANTEYAYEACKAASYLLWTMSGRKYTGEVTVTERYVCAKRAYRMGPSSKNYYATLIAGEVYNIPITDFQEYAELVSDGLSPESRIKLRGRPVTKIHAVRTRDGRILDPGSYYLVDHSTLQASAGVPWTPCNVEVTYTYGSTVPTAGKMAARTLAMEFAKLWSGDDDCILPQRVTSIARQGVTYTLLDSQDFIDDMRTGVYAIDLFLKSVNPDKARAKSRVFSPDVPRARRSTPKGPVLPVTVDFDIAVVKKTPATWTSVGKTTADVTLFFDEPGWTPVVTIRNTSAAKALDISTANITVNSGDQSVSFSVTYDEAYKTLGMVDPGTWTLYASKTVAGVTTLAEIETGNLQIKLYD